MSSHRPLRWTAAAVLLVLGFLPILNWIPGEHEAPWYGALLKGWISDSALVITAGLLLAILSRKLPWLWRPGWLDDVARRALESPRSTTVAFFAVALAIYAAVAWFVLSGKPLLIDEVVQVWQARVLASGHLWAPLPAHPEFTGITHLVDHDGRRFGQFPIGGPAMLALGTLVQAEWLVGPVFGAVSATLAWVLFRRVDVRPTVALGAALIFALAPFTAFMAGSHMNHVTALTWLMVAMVGLVRVVGMDRPRAMDGLIAGLGLGMAATIRPTDAAAFALPAAVWLAAHAWKTKHLAAFLASGVGVFVPIAGLLLVNAVTTGSPFLFAYELMWGPEVGLGFHSPPWGVPHTPVRGLEQINRYLLNLQEYFLESPFPALLPAGLALLLAPRLSAFDKYLLSASGLVLGFYFAYWHDGSYLGPRFVYPLIPVLALWTARVLPAWRSHSHGLAYRVAAYTLLVSVPMSMVTAIPIRAIAYRSGLQSMRFDADDAARRAGIRDAVILVRESWGAEVVVRLWALGISRGEAERLYRHVDTCLLDLTALDLEERGILGDSAQVLFEGLMRDSALVVRSGLSPDPTEMALSGSVYPPRCLSRIQDNWAGFTLFPPALLAGRDGNLFVRDLRERNMLLREEVRGRQVYLMRPPGHQVGLRPEFIRVSSDSVLGLP